MIMIISGTNRANSRSIKISEMYQRLLKDRNIESEIIDLAQLPHDFLFSALYENKGKDQAFEDFVKRVNNAKKFIFVVPEYNGSFPGVLKAFIDGMEYPGSFKNKKCALVGISSGVMGGSLALSHLTDIFNFLEMHVLAQKPRIPRINGILVDSKITDPVLMKLVEAQVDAFIEF